MDTALIVPRLPAGEHHLLRPWELGDLPLVREASQDPYIPLITSVPPEYSPEAGEAFIRRQWGRAATASGYPFIIMRRQDGKPIGNIGLWLKESSAGRASAGYWLAASARGQGAAAPALQAVADWALTDSRASACTSSRGTSHRSEQPSAPASSVRDCYAAGSSSATGAET